MNKAGSGSNSETHRKLFIGGLNYSTTDDALKEYFSKYGELVDCVVMKFRDTKRSRGFGFVTYATIEMVDECQNNRPHTIDGTKVETKRATPRDDNGPGSGQTVQKLFLGGLKDGVTDDNLRDYFGKFGTVTNVEQMTDKVNSLTTFSVNIRYVLIFGLIFSPMVVSAALVSLNSMIMIPLISAFWKATTTWLMVRFQTNIITIFI